MSWQIIGNLGRINDRRNPDLRDGNRTSGWEQAADATSASSEGVRFSSDCSSWWCCNNHKVIKQELTHFSFWYPFSGHRPFQPPCKCQQGSSDSGFWHYIEVCYAYVGQQERNFYRCWLDPGWTQLGDNPLSEEQLWVAFSFLWLFGLLSWLLFTEGMEDASKEDMCFVTDSGLQLA